METCRARQKCAGPRRIGESNKTDGFALLEQGKGVAVARDVIIARNYSFENSNTVTLDAITRTTTLANAIG